MENNNDISSQELASQAHEYEVAAVEDQRHVWHHLTQHKGLEQHAPMMIVSGDGMRVKADDGKEYLDAVSGAVWTVNVGFGRERIAKVVYDQLVRLNFFAGSVGTLPAAHFSEMLTEVMPGMSRVYYSNSGSEANEKAYKIVRQIAHQNNNGVKHKTLYRDRDYHGTTITTLSSSGQEQRKAQYGPYTPDFIEVPSCCCYRCPFNKTFDSCDLDCAQAVEKVIQAEGPETVGSLVLEPITAGGGVILPPEGYLPMVADICKKYDVLLHIDEVVCGLGRTGTWFGYQHYGIQPDIVTMAKGLASGYAAISCTVTTEGVFDQFKSHPEDPMSYFRDISTFGGCTAGPAAAIENMNILKEEKLLENTTVIGEYALDRLRGLMDKYEIIGDVRGLGLFLGIELVKDRKTKEPVEEQVVIDIFTDCMQQGVIIGRTNRSFEKLNNVICLAPALIAGKNEIDEIVTAIDIALQKISI